LDGAQRESVLGIMAELLMEGTEPRREDAVRVIGEKIGGKFIPLDKFGARRAKKDKLAAPGPAGRACTTAICATRFLSNDLGF
jgi:hypothetical protein